MGYHHNVYFKKNKYPYPHPPAPQGIGKSKRVGDPQRLRNVKESMKLNWNFWWGRVEEVQYG